MPKHPQSINLGLDSRIEPVRDTQVDAPETEIHTAEITEESESTEEQKSALEKTVEHARALKNSIQALDKIIFAQIEPRGSFVFDEQLSAEEIKALMDRVPEMAEGYIRAGRQIVEGIIKPKLQELRGLDVSDTKDIKEFNAIILGLADALKAAEDYVNQSLNCNDTQVLVDAYKTKSLEESGFASYELLDEEIHMLEYTYQECFTQEHKLRKPMFGALKNNGRIKALYKKRSETFKRMTKLRGQSAVQDTRKPYIYSDNHFLQNEVLQAKESTEIEVWDKITTLLNKDLSIATSEVDLKKYADRYFTGNQEDDAELLRELNQDLPKVKSILEVEDVIKKTYKRLTQSMERIGNERERLIWSIKPPQSLYNLNWSATRQTLDALIRQERITDIFLDPRGGQLSAEEIRQFASNLGDIARTMLVQSMWMMKERAPAYGRVLCTSGNPGHAGITVLNAFRDPGYSGEYPLINREYKPGIREYVHALSDEDIVKIKSLNIPGLSETIEIIKNNNKFSEPQIWDGQESKTNPAFGEAEKNLIKIGTHFLENGTADEQAFALGSLSRLHVDLGNAVYNMIEKKWLSDRTISEYDITEFIRIRFNRYAPDFEQAAHLIINNYSRLHKPLLSPTKIIMLQSLVHLTGSELTTKQLQAVVGATELNEATKMSEEQVRNAYAFLDSCTTVGVSGPHSALLKTENPDFFWRSAELAQYPGLAKFAATIEARVPEASKFDFTHSTAWVSLLPFKEQIVKAIEKNNACGPFFFSFNTLKYLTANPEKAELILMLPDRAPVVMDTENNKMYSTILENAELLANKETLDFIRVLTGKHGKLGDQLLAGFSHCLKEGVVTHADYGLILEFTDRFRIISPAIVSAYKTAKQERTVELLLSKLESMTERMTVNEPLTEAERALPYYPDLIRDVYPHNAGSYASYENVASCRDRIEDLAKYTVRQRYEMDLLAAGTITIKNGETGDEIVISNLKKPILDLAQKAGGNGYDTAAMRLELEKAVNQDLENVEKKGGFGNTNIKQITDSGEKLFLLMMESLYGSNGLDRDRLKELLLQHQFAYFEDVREYVQGTTDRVSNAQNKDYALLCELHNFYSDRIKEVNRSLVHTGFTNPNFQALIRKYFGEQVKKLSDSDVQGTLNRLQVDKLGLNQNFLNQLARVVNKKTGKKYTPEKLQKLIRRYEHVTGGLTAANTESRSGRTKALYGQLKSQRDKTLKAFEILGKGFADPTTVHLGEMNLQEYLTAQQQLQSGEYHEEQFASYTVQKFVQLFEQEVSNTEIEINKYESSAGRGRQRLNGYISKTKETAHARMVAGVCVSGDNPARGKTNQWDMENYLQMVLQDPENKRCQGVILLHDEKEGDKRTLTASFNPSSTYLYGVDEEALFASLKHALEQFAEDNNFDQIAISQQSAIRTNRTGGSFEQSMDKAIIMEDDAIGISQKKSFQFSEPKRFSFHPEYLMQDMHIIWEDPRTKT